MMRKMKNILVMFIAIFAIFMLGKNVNAVSIVTYHKEADIEKAIINVSESKTLKDVEKKSKIEEIMRLSSKDELKSLIEKKINKVQQALKDDKMVMGINQKVTKKIDNLASVNIESKDEAEDENGNPIPEVGPQAQMWKAYGARMYTYAFKVTVVPYVLAFNLKLINHYTVSAKGLTVRSIDDARVAGAGLKISNKYSKWEDRSANKVGTDIDSKAKWEVEVFPGIPVAGHLTEFTYFQKAYIKIVKWDKKKKKMYLNQHGKYWVA